MGLGNSERREGKQPSFGAACDLRRAGGLGNSQP